MWNDFRGRAVLVTGGTLGLGLATGLAFGRRGAHVTLTQKWGSADPEQVRRAFAEAGAPEPDLVDADVSQDADTRGVLERIRERHERLEAFVSNVAFGQVVSSLEAYSRRALGAGIDYSAWPMVSYTQRAREVFGEYPRYVVGISSEGVESMHVGYDLIAASKAVLESLCRYMHYRLRDQGVRVNVVRTRFVDTASLSATFGEPFAPFLRRYAPGALTPPEEVGEAVFGVCSGLMDGLGGEVLTVDRGASVYENFSGLYESKRVNPKPEKESP